MNFYIYTDGASRGNPGLAGAGAYIKCLQKSVKKEVEISIFLGIKTNNEAEYLGALVALKWLQRQNLSEKDEIVFHLDSQLVVKQLEKEWKIKSKKLKKIAEQCNQIKDQFPCLVEFKHILRDKNSYADNLANQAIDLAKN
ncbi:MAG: ribonuclease HI family protein [Patescibacteria group bacterium]|nr:ribonuclease HI family protein [Patescibacteria group bacterium]